MEYIKHQDIEAQLQELTDSRPPEELMFPLRDFARGLLAEGYPREELLGAFEHVRENLRERDDEEREDAVMDVMDFLTGWCAPHARL